MRRKSNEDNRQRREAYGKFSQITGLQRRSQDLLAVWFHPGPAKGDIIMSTAKEDILSMIRREIGNTEDDLYRYRRQSRRLTAEEMDKPYVDSTNTLREIIHRLEERLDEYRSMLEVAERRL